MRDGLKDMGGGAVVNDNEAGSVFYHRHLAPRARKRKKKARLGRRAAKRRNR